MWTLHHRYHKCKDILNSGMVDIQSTDNVAYVYIWLRYSFIRQITWQRKYNTKPKDLQHAIVCLVGTLCDKYRESFNQP